MNPRSQHRSCVDYRGIVFDNNEGLHAILDENGFTRLYSGIEMPMCMYRGQVKEYVPGVPSLGRLKTVDEQLLALCRNAAFEQAIGEHPFVRVADQARFLGSPLFIDKQGLTQHYGLATDMLDVTSNFDVASFFAVCRWDDQQKGYLPLMASEKPGVIYGIIPTLLTNPFPTDDDEQVFGYIGWQPLNRPEQQRACGVKLKNGENLLSFPSIRRFYFRHDPAISVRIWNAFDQGKALFPEDPAAFLAEQAHRLQSFTREQVDIAWTRLETWLSDKFDNETRTDYENRLRLDILENPVLSWNGLGVEKDETTLNRRLNEVLIAVRHRLAAYL